MSEAGTQVKRKAGDSPLDAMGPAGTREILLEGRRRSGRPQECRSLGPTASDARFPRHRSDVFGRHWDHLIQHFRMGRFSPYENCMGGSLRLSPRMHLLSSLYVGPSTQKLLFLRSRCAAMAVALCKCGLDMLDSGVCSLGDGQADKVGINSLPRVRIPPTKGETPAVAPSVGGSRRSSGVSSSKVMNCKTTPPQGKRPQSHAASCVARARATLARRTKRS